VEKEEIRSTLTIPLYWTFHLENVLDFQGLPDRQIAEFREGYGSGELAAMIEALAWAEEHPEEDYASMLPGLRYSSEVLHRYLTVLRRQFEEKYREWFGGNAVPS
jgi:hypothetical protein